MSLRAGGFARGRGSGLRIVVAVAPHVAGARPAGQPTFVMSNRRFVTLGGSPGSLFGHVMRNVMPSAVPFHGWLIRLVVQFDCFWNWFDHWTM